MASGLQITWEDLSTGIKLAKQFSQHAVFLGSGPQADVQIAGQGLDDLHLEFRNGDGFIQLREVGKTSPNATVDGQAIPRSTWRTLTASHEVCLVGRIKLRVDVTDVHGPPLTGGAQSQSAPPPQVPQRQATEPLPVKSKVFPGQLISHYRIEKMLGEGGMGVVYEATHVRMNAKRFALKILLAEAEHVPHAETRFFREAEAISRIQHPHVVNVIDFGKQGDVTYIVMEKLEGEDLAARIARGPLVGARACDIMLAVASAVQAAHDLGILHRDLKPANIFLATTSTGDNIPKVLDFGISKFDGSQVALPLTAASMLLGTPHYLSPEQAAGVQSGDARSDQYALAAIVYECVTGQRVHQADNLFGLLREIATSEPVAISSLVAGVPPQLEAVIMRGLSRDPIERFESVHAFGKALLPFASTKHKAFWTDFYGRDNLQQVSSAFDAIPLTASRYRSSQEDLKLPATKLLPGSERLHAESNPQREIRKTAARKTHGSLLTAATAKRTRKMAVLMVLGASAAGAAWLALSRSENAPATQESRIPSVIQAERAQAPFREEQGLEPPKAPIPVAPPPVASGPPERSERAAGEARSSGQQRHRRKTPKPVRFNESGIPILK